MITWHEMWQSLQAHTIALFGNDAFIQIAKLAKKLKIYIVISNGNVMYSVMRDLHDTRRVPMERGWVVLYLYMLHVNIQIKWL